MKYIKLLSATVNGLKIEILNLEISILKGLPRFEVTGLKSNSGQEIFSRIRAALLNNGFTIPKSRIICNISPEIEQLQDNSLDLAIAVGILIADRQIYPKNNTNYFIVGKLNLAGKIEGIKGLYAMRQIKQTRKHKWIIPEINAAEMQFEKESDQIFPVTDINRAVEVVLEKNIHLFSFSHDNVSKPQVILPDYQPVIAQPLALRALEIAIAGWHPLLLIGSPGCGKSSIAQFAKCLLPHQDEETAREIRELYSIQGHFSATIHPDFQPFEAPHYSISPLNFIGGGRKLMPGVITLAHQGILYLDELSEFKSSTLQLLRKPLSEQKIELRNHTETQVYPANFLLIASMNPCPCGYYFEANNRCHCKTNEIMTYKRKITGALLDRFQLSVTMLNLSDEDLMKTAVTNNNNINPYVIRKRIKKAREIQFKRCYEQNIPKAHNAYLETTNLAKCFRISNMTLKAFQKSISGYHFSPRSYLSVLRVARTISDLAAEEELKLDFLHEALMFRIKSEIY